MDLRVGEKVIREESPFSGYAGDEAGDFMVSSLCIFRYQKLVRIFVSACKDNIPADPLSGRKADLFKVSKLRPVLRQSVAKTYFFHHFFHLLICSFIQGLRKSFPVGRSLSVLSLSVRIINIIQ